MANQQNQQDQQDQQDQQEQTRQQQGQQNQQRATPGQNAEAGRSENLLPAGAAGNSPDDSADGRFEVAEEVSLDQQSDATRRVGKPPKGIPSDALADTLKPDPNRDDSSGA